MGTTSVPPAALPDNAAVDVDCVVGVSKLEFELKSSSNLATEVECALSLDK
jgi:hypothetical protein